MNDIDDMNAMNTPSIDILDQIAAYSQAETENFYYKLKEDYTAQLKLNNILKKNNYDENIKSIDNFIARNTTEVDYQLERLTKLSTDFQNIVTENNTLKEEYINLIKSESCINISKKLKEIKDIKEKLMIFLQKAGI